VPSQVIGVALSRLPESVLNPVLGLLRRATVPDLRAFGLPAPSRNGYSQFLRSQTLPILDHGFVAAVREHRIAVVPAVTGFAAGRVRLADGQTVAPDDVIAATGYRPALQGMVGHLGVLDERGLPRTRGARTVPGCDGLYFVGISVQLSGLLREIGREARAVAEALADLGAEPSARVVRSRCRSSRLGWVDC
jgi:putative flavoprotein involved in K+ transport